MKVTNIHEAKTHLSRLVERVVAGEEIVIGKAGKPVAKLVPYTEPKPLRKPGGMKGKIKYLTDWDQADKEIEALFCATPIEPPVRPPARHPRTPVVARVK
jgi:prevent-host-death family protein